MPNIRVTVTQVNGIGIADPLYLAWDKCIGGRIIFKPGKVTIYNGVTVMNATDTQPLVVDLITGFDKEGYAVTVYDEQFSIQCAVAQTPAAVLVRFYQEP